MRRAGAVAGLLLLAACGREGVALRLDFADVCVAPAVAQLSFEAALGYADGGGEARTQTAALGGVALADFEALLLLPAATRTVTVTVRALDAAGAEVAVGATREIAFDGPGTAEETVLLASAGCGDLAPGPPDFAITPPDLSGIDGLPAISAIEAAGRRGLPYEGEGSASPTADDGVAILITGLRFKPTYTVTSRYDKITVGQVRVSGDGTRIATSVRIEPDETVTAGSLLMVPLAVNVEPGIWIEGTFTLRGLDELTTGGNLEAVAAAPLMYARIEAPGAELTLTGGSRGYLWVPGSVTLANLSVDPGTAGGFAGCTIQACNAGAHGPGFGAGGAVGQSGGGAGYGEMGSAGTGTNGGAAYGDPSLIGLPGGSGGGAGQNGVHPGGSGGGVLRLEAGRVTLSGTARADGQEGESVLLAQGAGGGGSGGSLLVQARHGFSGGLSVAPGPGGGGGALGQPGGNGAVGRARVDVGVAQALPGAAGYAGAMIAAGWPTAHQGAPAAVDVVCGLASRFQLEVDGVVQSAPRTCASAGAPAVESVPFNTPPAPGALHQVCVRVLPVAGAPIPHYPPDYAEDLDCRSIAVVD